MELSLGFLETVPLPHQHHAQPRPGARFFGQNPESWW